jgi:hypothetical protein
VKTSPETFVAVVAVLLMVAVLACSEAISQLFVSQRYHRIDAHGAACGDMSATFTR